MGNMNYGRIALGALAGWFVLLLFEMLWVPLWAVLFSIDMETYMETTPQPRWGMAGFYATWFSLLFLLSGTGAWLYATARNVLGPGPRTAALIGCAVGFAAGFPVNFLGYLLQSTEMSRVVFLAVDLWVGLILATLVAAWLYKE